MQTRLLFYKGRHPGSSIWDKLICFATNSEFSHVELSLQSDGNAYHCWSSSFMDGGVRGKIITIDPAKWVIVDCDRPVNTEVLISQIGKKYDYIGLIGTLIKIRIFESSNKWFCSELIATALGMENAWQQTPKSIYENRV